jgi:hypothetical protein
MLQVNFDAYETPALVNLTLLTNGNFMISKKNDYVNLAKTINIWLKINLLLSEEDYSNLITQVTAPITKKPIYKRTPILKAQKDADLADQAEMELAIEEMEQGDYIMDMQQTSLHEEMARSKARAEVESSERRLAELASLAAMEFDLKQMAEIELEVGGIR